MNLLRSSRQEEDLTLEKQAKFVEERFKETEEFMAKLCSVFDKFTMRTAKYRDANDQLAVAVHECASKEQINKTFKASMEKLAQSLADLGAYRDYSTIYLQEEVMESLMQYTNRCKNSHLEIKKIYRAKEKELSKRKQLSKIRQRFPQNVQVIMKAESDLAEACSKLAKMQGDLEEYALSFERSKLDDLKRLLRDFVKAELVFHVGALETLTQATKEVNEIDIEADYNTFKNTFLRPNIAHRLDIVRRSCPPVQISGLGGGIPLNNGDHSDSLRTVEVPTANMTTSNTESSEQLTSEAAEDDSQEDSASNRSDNEGKDEGSSLEDDSRVITVRPISGIPIAAPRFTMLT